MTVCHMEQALGDCLGGGRQAELREILDDVQVLLGKLR
jgi:hypothetical protein